MAGESPDKSEQRKSSGETAPGERDPRLAVFRQASPGPTAPQADQATAVFRLPAERTDSEPEAEPGTESGSTENDARLRAAVAAWVASADDSTDAGAVDADAQGADEAPGALEGDAGTPEDADAPGAVDAGADGTDVPVAPAAEEGDDAPADDEPGADAAEDGPDAVTGGDEAPGAPEPDAGTPEDADAPGAVDAGADERDVPVAPAAEEGDDAPVDDEPGADAAEDGPDAGTPGADEAPDAVAEEGDDAAAEAEPAAADKADADGDDGAPAPDADVRSTDESAPADAAPAPRGEDADRATDAPADAKPVNEAEAEDDAAKPGEPSAKDKGGSEAAPESAEAKAPAKPAVDQPTAVFKALRRPAVDQPTTALKVPPAPRPEAPAERSSTFVPLRAEAPAPASASAPAPASLTESERTKQQPMPPLPPLDLLAELTNTPPPPQTPVRTVVRRIKIWTPLVILLLIIFAVVQVLRPLPDPELSLSAEPTFTFKGGKLDMPWPDEGQGAVEVEGVGSIGTYGAQKPAPIASVAKTMTAYVILQEHPISGKQVGEKITVDQQAEDESKIEDESTAQISKGQQFTEKQMLQLLMIPSGNNAARLLARWDSKSEAEFVKKMNDAAKKLGMTDSTYTDPSGLKATTVSSPQDQLKLARAVLQNDIFRDIVNTPNITIPGIDGRIENNNRILLKPGVSGIKTGSSTPAGGNLLWTADTLVDGKKRRIVGAVMGAQNAALLHEKLTLAVETYSLQLIQAAQEGVTSATVVKKGEVVGHIDDGLGGEVAVVATKDLKAVGWAGLQVQIAINDEGTKIPHSAKAGTVVGQVSIGSGTGKVTAPVALQQDLAEPGFGDKLTRLG